jgi:hypothetical protein
MLISIYGNNLGPEHGCVGQADTRRTETPNPARPWQNTLIYPAELCGVQVFLGDLAAGLLYVQDKQINFKVPLDAATDGAAELRVVYQGQTNSLVRVPLGLETATLSVDGSARVGGPVWIKIDMPYGWNDIQYPLGFVPLDFGCNQIEVRQNGVLLPRIPVRPAPIMFNGNLCGNGFGGHPPQHTGRLPVHLQYRFEKPGTYEVRYTLRSGIFGPGDRQVLFQSVWTRIEVLSAEARPRQIPPVDPAEILSDYLPSVLGFSDAAGLEAALGYLYDSNELVRRYAESALLYWPREEVERRAAGLIRAKGPTDVLVNLAGLRGVELMDAILPYLASDNPVILRGAIRGVSGWISDPRQALPADVRARAESRLLGSVEHVVRVGDEQMRTELAAALGSVRGDLARDVLWSLANRGIARQQALIAIAWHKDPRDLARLGAMITGSPEDFDRSRDLASIPYAIRNSYGDAAVPFLEAALKRSVYDRLRSNCAQELIIAGKPSGFAFVVDAIQQNRSYRPEMVQFVRDRFPELKAADEGNVLAFVKQRAI